MTRKTGFRLAAFLVLLATMLVACDTIKEAFTEGGIPAATDAAADALNKELTDGDTNVDWTTVGSGAVIAGLLGTGAYLLRKKKKNAA